LNQIIKFGIVGFGHIGKRHFEEIANNSFGKVLAVVDVNKEALNSVGNDVNTYTDMQEMLLTEKEIEVVCVCTPNGLHASQALIAIKDGKHVVVEKPLALKAEDVQQMMDLAGQKQVNIFGVMQNRYSPPVKWLKHLVDNRTLGTIYFIQVNCFWNRDERYYQKGSWRGSLALDGGTLFTQFSHFVDLLHWIFGELSVSNTRFYNFNHAELSEFEDSGTFDFNALQGAVGNFNYSTAVNAKNFESSITIIAENGTVKIGGQYMDRVDYCEIENYDQPQLEASNPANDYGHYTGSANNHNKVIDNVIAVLQGKEQIKTTAQEGLRVVKTIEEIYRHRGA
jgi:predicted dehydrogenase